MKKTLIVLLLIQGLLLNAQQPPKMLKYNATNAANIFYYQVDEVIDKVKIKKDKIENGTRRALRVYNNKIKDISFLNSQKLNELESAINSLGDQIRTNPDIGRRLRKNIETLILPIRDSIEKFEKKMNGALNVIFSKKQYKKWIKFQKNEKRKLLPKRPKNTNARAPTNRRRNRGGMGRRNNRF